jgi:hypothetical protein
MSVRVPPRHQIQTVDRQPHVVNAANGHGSTE